MIIKINKAELIITRLKAEGKVTYLDSPEQQKAILEMNTEMEDVKREYQLKERNSQISAANVVLNS